MWSKPTHLLSKVLIGSTLALLLSTFAANARPSNFETNLKLKRPISETATSSAAARIVTNFSEISYRHLDLGLQLALPTDWQLGAHYRALRKKSNTDQWLREDRFYLQAEKRFSSSRTSWIAIRNRLEFRSRQDKDHAYRYRLRFKLKSTQKLFCRLKPFISNEFFYDLSKHHRSANRFDIGLDLGKVNGFKHSVYLKFVSRQKNGQWVSQSSLVYTIAI